MAGASRQEVQSLLHVVRLSGLVLTFFVLARTRCWHYRAWPMWTTLAALGGGLVITTAGMRPDSRSFLAPARRPSARGNAFSDTDFIVLKC